METAKKTTRKAAVKNVVTEDATQDFLNGKGMGPKVEDFVFMEKTAQILNIGFDTEKNIVLYGPGE